MYTTPTLPYAFYPFFFFFFGRCWHSINRMFAYWIQKTIEYKLLLRLFSNENLEEYKNFHLLPLCLRCLFCKLWWIRKQWRTIRNNAVYFYPMLLSLEYFLMEWFLSALCPSCIRNNTNNYRSKWTIDVSNFCNVHL